MNQLLPFMAAVGKIHAALLLSEEVGLHRLMGKITLCHLGNCRGKKTIKKQEQCWVKCTISNCAELMSFCALFFLIRQSYRKW